MDRPERRRLREPSPALRERDIMCGASRVEPALDENRRRHGEMLIGQRPANLIERSPSGEMRMQAVFA